MTGNPGHASALLVPEGRVLSMGGGHRGAVTDRPIGEYFQPQHSADPNAPRPIISFGDRGGITIEGKPLLAYGGVLNASVTGPTPSRFTPNYIHALLVLSSGCHGLQAEATELGDELRPPPLTHGPVRLSFRRRSRRSSSPFRSAARVCDAPLMRLGTVALLVTTMFSCESTPAPDQDAGSGSGTTSTDRGSSTTDLTRSSSPTDTTSESSSSKGSESSSSSGDESSSSGDESSSSGEPAPTFGEPEALPTPDGACPTFESGTLEFSPGETGPRSARVWVDPGAGGGGPLVFYWHGTGSNPLEAEFGLGQVGIDDILERGGMVVAPVSDPDAGRYPWYLVLGQEEDDIHLMDEIVGCAAEGPGIDPSRIHALGMSTGGLQTSQVSVRRSSYIASVVTYSGGILNAEIVSDDPGRPFPALIYHGGPKDIAVISFQEASERYRNYIESLGGYSLICDHGGGHSIPDARVYSWQFLLDHPFDIAPSPYEGDLPSWVPEYCVE